MIVSGGVPVGGSSYVCFERGAYPSNAYELGVNPLLLEVVHNHGKNEIDTILSL